MVVTGWSVHLTTLFPGKLEQAVNQYFVHILSLVTDNNPSWTIHSAEGRRMTLEIISRSISTKVWDWAEIELPTPGSAVRHASVAIFWGILTGFLHIFFYIKLDGTFHSKLG